MELERQTRVPSSDGVCVKPIRQRNGGFQNGLGTDSVDQGWRRQALAEFSDSAWTFCHVPGGCPHVPCVVARPNSTDNVEAAGRRYTLMRARVCYPKGHLASRGRERLLAPF